MYNWLYKYIGLEFERYNCWQLVCLIYKNEFGIDLPTFKDEYNHPFDRDGIKAICDRELSNRFIRLDEPKIDSIIVLRMAGQPWHIGMVVDKDLMIHTHSGINAVIEKFTSPLWIHRVIGFYEYRPDN